MSTASLFPFNFQQISNITPYTYNTGGTMLEQLYDLRDYVTKNIAPWFDGEMTGLLTQFEAGIANCEAQITANELTHQTATDAFTAAINATVTAFEDQINASIGSISNRVGPENIHTVTLSANTSLTIDPVWPTAHPILFEYVQDGTGGWTVTGGPGITGSIAVNPAPGSYTEVTLTPNGAGVWRASTPDTRAAALASDPASALSAALGNLYPLKTNLGTSTVLYVSAAGNNTNDGKTWYRAKATVAGALATLAAGPGMIEVGPGTITETTPWGTIPSGIVVRGSGKRATVILKAFGGDLATLADGAEVRNLTIDGQGTTYTGRCFVFAGTDGNQILTDTTLKNFDGYCLDFAVAAGSGFKATNLEVYRTAAGTGTGRYAINISPTQQLGAVPRSFVALTTAGQCSVSFGGCNDTFITNSFLADLAFTPDSRGVNITGSRIANQVALTVDGHNNSITGCDIAPTVTIAAGADAITIGPGSFNNLPVIDNAGNDRNNVTHWEVAYTPTLTSGGTAPVLGNGTLSGRWSRSGTIINITVELIVGSTTTLGTGGLRFSLPKARVNGLVTTIGSAIMVGGATNYTAAARIPGNVGYVELIRDTTASVTFNSPATFAAGDTFRFSGTYQL